MLPGEMIGGGAIDDRTTHNYKNDAIIHATIITIRQPATRTATIKGKTTRHKKHLKMKK